MFGKVFASLWQGSMAGAGPVNQLVFIYCLSNSDRDGFVQLNPLLVAAALGTSENEVEKAIEFLKSPDPNSRNQKEEGRRITNEGPYLYHVVNHDEYREIHDQEALRAYWRGLKTSENVRDKTDSPGNSRNPSASVSDISPSPSPKKKNRSKRRDGYSEDFEAFWSLYPRQEAKKPASVSWERLSDADKALAMEAIPKHAAMWAREGREKKVIPHATTWLNQERWADRIDDTMQSVDQTDEMTITFRRLAQKFGCTAEDMKAYWDKEGATPTTKEQVDRFLEVPF
jgi:hypothetical protein